jgi:hypothetical protein
MGTPAVKRRISIRGDTYGIVCVAFFLLLAAAAIITIRLIPRRNNAVSAKPPWIISAPLPSPSLASVPTPPSVPIAGYAAAAAALANGLAYSRSLGTSRLIEKGTISPQAGGYSATFQYERLNNSERIQVDGGNFVRRIGGEWVRSDGWSLAGTPASAGQTSMLNDLMAMAVVAWDKGSGSEPVKLVEVPKEESSFKVAYLKPARGSGDQLFAFRKVGSSLQLERFSGAVGSGKDQVHLTLDYSYPAGSTPGTVANPNAPPSVVIKAPSQAKSKSTRQTASARKSVRPR